MRSAPRLGALVLRKQRNESSDSDHSTSAPFNRQARILLAVHNGDDLQVSFKAPSELEPWLYPASAPSWSRQFHIQCSHNTLTAKPEQHISFPRPNRNIPSRLCGWLSIIIWSSADLLLASKHAPRKYGHSLRTPTDGMDCRADGQVPSYPGTGIGDSDTVY